MNVKNTLLPVQTLLQSGGRLLDLSKPAVMGILNATSDSFYNKGRESSTADLVTKAEKMLADGASILDIGGASTKPGSLISDPHEEMERVLPVVKEICKRFPGAWLSVDTYHAAVAKAAVEEGVSIVNDVSAGRFDNAMMTTVAELNVPFIIMHMQGMPETMQRNPVYNDVVSEVLAALKDSCHDCDLVGIADVIVDPGFGFGKTPDHNFSLLKNLGTFRVLGKPVLAGISRKSIVCRTLNISPEEALNGTTALNMIALQQGANILRVHDVKEAVEVVKLYMQFLQSC